MSVEENKRVSEKYHMLDPANMDEILTSNFRGEHFEGGTSWDLESHKKTWSTMSATDTILEQFGEGDRICTRFTREGVWRGKRLKHDMLQIKTFRDGKIAHIWEYYDSAAMKEEFAD
jgi:ketosteroid isomerase-like protein